MRFNDYKLALESDKLEWLNEIKMQTALNYFGGKAKIGQYLLNQIFNLIVEMEKDGGRPTVFLDCFTGGGKVGASMPWFDDDNNLIVMNDYNWGIYNYYKYCQGDYIALIKMIDKIGVIMDEDLFKVALSLRSDRRTDPLTAAALTYWVTYSSFNGITSEKYANYSLPYKVDASRFVTVGELASYRQDGHVEQEAIQRLIRLAHKRIPALHERFTQQNYNIENLDYRELIKKYNGKPYREIGSEKPKTETKYKDLRKLFYFDPPYHPYTLHGGKEAPYADSFTVEMSEEMTDILSGNQSEVYGSIDYFVKSDYSLKETLNKAKTDIKRKKCPQKDWLNELISIDKKNPEAVSHSFDALEVFPYCRIPLGTFDKGAISEEERTQGYEFIWCKGFSKEYIISMKEDFNLDILCTGL